MIRGETINYSSYEKKQITEKEVTLEREIQQLEEQVQNNLNDISMGEIMLLNDKKEKLEEIRKIKMDGVMLRSRCRYEDLGEKSTHYANIPICFIPQVSPFYIVEKVKLGVLKMKVYFLVLTRMVKEGVVTC